MKQNIVQFILIYIFSIITLLFLSIIVNFVSISIFLSEAVFSYENIFIFVFTNSIIFFFFKKNIC